MLYKESDRMEIETDIFKVLKKLPSAQARVEFVEDLIEILQVDMEEEDCFRG